MEPLFDHDRLEVYRMGREFNRQIYRVLDEVGRGHTDSTITRNIAEGSGKWSIKDKIRF